MKILFLHLSDTHFTDAKINVADTKNMSKALHQIGKFDECAIFYTGDVASRGEVNEYRNASLFLGKLIEIIKKDHLNKYINVYVVPGNHDIQNMDELYTFDEINEAYKNKKQEDFYWKYNNNLQNYFEFSRRNKCFMYKTFFEYTFLTFGNFKIKINLINTAPFSLLGRDSKDKGLHYLMESDINSLGINKGENYTITLMHHSSEWFNEKSKNLLRDALVSNTDLLMIGHEHYSLGESKIINAKHHMSESRGISLDQYSTEFGFNAFILDTEECTLKGKKFIKNGSYYRPEVIIEDDKIKFKKQSGVSFDKEFNEKIKMDINERQGKNINDYFVFPTLKAKLFDDTKHNSSINNEEQFMELLIEKKRISIEGGIDKGKTTLAKHLCDVLSEQYIVILIDSDKFALDTNKIIKYQVNNQFGSNLSFDEFEQIEVDKKVLIIDDLDKVREKKRDKFFNNYTDDFGYIITFNSSYLNMDIKGKAVEALKEDNFYELQIEPFYYEKRLQLINKICSKKNEGIKGDIEERAKAINNEISNQLRYFQLTPDFIHQFVEYSLSAAPILKGTKQENVFNIVYETNITLRLMEVANEELIPEIITALDFVAGSVHFNKKYPLSVEDFKNAIEQYNEKYDNNINAQVVKNVAIKAHIIREVSGQMTYEFCDNNLLAYFTAAHLHRRLNEGECGDKLEEILDNISEGINGDILLFLSYKTDNVKVLYPIIDSIEKHMGVWTEFDIDKNNVEYITEIKCSGMLSLPTKKEKKEHVDNKDKIERELHETKETPSSELYSKTAENEDELIVKISKALAYLDIIAKILPSFRHILNGDLKNKIVEILYSYPNKLLYAMLKDIDENHKEIVDEILKQKIKTKQGDLVSQQMIEKALVNQSIGFILSIYDLISSAAVTSRTLQDFNRQDFKKNTNYELQNLLMEEAAVEFDNFLKKANDIFDNSEVEVVKRMVALIVRKYYLCHDNIPTIGESQKVLDKMFDTKTQKQFLLENTRKKSKKE